MKLRIEKFLTLFMIAIISLAGCSGCAQKESPEKPIVSPNQSNPDVKPSPSGVKRNEVKPKPRGKTAKVSSKNFSDLDYLTTLKGVEYIELTRENKGGIPLPWDPLTVSVELWKSRLEKQNELLIGMRSKKITLEEYNEQALQVYREDGFVTTIQRIIELSGSTDEKIRRMVDLMYAENPDDFDTLLLWVIAGGIDGNWVYSYGEEKTAATRRLYEMNPNHPWVLHKLAKCLLGTNPQEALGYAQKAQELDPRYLPLGVEGLCYFQMGDYRKALASFRRSRQYAVATSQPSYIIKAIGSWVGDAEDVVNSGGKGEEGRERKRKGGTPILGRSLPTSLYR